VELIVNKALAEPDATIDKQKQTISVLQRALTEVRNEANGLQQANTACNMEIPNVPEAPNEKLQDI
jgi:hypothetical protein